MKRSTFLQSLWALLVAGMFTGATFYGYSPFADGGRASPGAAAYGPTHK